LHNQSTTEQMNYQVIMDEKILKEFIDFLPELEANEYFCLSLLARTKYCKNEDGTNKFAHIKSDKEQLKRIVAKKENILDKIKQCEVAFGTYKTKTDEPIPQEALALYVTINPRNQKKALFKLQRQLLNILETNRQDFNINAESVSALYKSKSRTCWIDFDIDSKEIDLSLMNELMPPHCYKVLETRGGYHIMINKKNSKEAYTPYWHLKMSELFDVDQNADNMVPVPETYQGGFVPRFLDIA